MRVLSGVQPSGNLHIGNYFGEDGPDDLLFVARSFHPAVDLERIRRSMYLTFGDSDLM